MRIEANDLDVTIPLATALEEMKSFRKGLGIQTPDGTLDEESIEALMSVAISNFIMGLVWSCTNCNCPSAGFIAAALRKTFSESQSKYVPFFASLETQVERMKINGPAFAKSAAAAIQKLEKENLDRQNSAAKN